MSGNSGFKTFGLASIVAMAVGVFASSDIHAATGEAAVEDQLAAAQKKIAAIEESATPEERDNLLAYYHWWNDWSNWANWYNY